MAQIRVITTWPVPRATNFHGLIEKSKSHWILVIFTTTISFVFFFFFFFFFSPQNLLTCDFRWWPKDVDVNHLDDYSLSFEIIVTYRETRCSIATEMNLGRCIIGNWWQGTDRKYEKLRIHPSVIPFYLTRPMGINGLLNLVPYQI